MQDWQAEERCAGLIIGDLWKARVGAVEVVDADSRQEGEQGTIGAAIERDRIVGSGIDGVAGGFEILQVVAVAEPGDVRIEPPVGVIGEIEFVAMLELDLVAIGIDGDARHSVSGGLGREIIEVV